MRSVADIENRLASLQERMADPTLPKAAYGILFGRIEELEWVLDRKRDDDLGFT